MSINNILTFFIWIIFAISVKNITRAIIVYTIIIRDFMTKHNLDSLIVFIVLNLLVENITSIDIYKSVKSNQKIYFIS